jgi:N-formylglutamate amidohydrolase
MVATLALCLLSQNPASLITIMKGELPIVLSAPHGGKEPIPGVPERSNKTVPQFATVRDTGTDLLTLEIAKEVESLFGKKPWMVVAKFSRKYIDANRSKEHGVESDIALNHYENYHQSLRNAVDEARKQSPRALLLDIHGQGSDRTVIFRGTQNRRTVRGLIETIGEVGFTGSNSFLGQLEKSGIALVPKCNEIAEKETAKFNGGYIVSTYGSHRKDGIDAIQLETGGDQRNKENLSKTAKLIAAALKVHYDQYMVNPQTYIQFRER